MVLADLSNFASATYNSFFSHLAICYFHVMYNGFLKLLWVGFMVEVGKAGVMPFFPENLVPRPCISRVPS